MDVRTSLAMIESAARMSETGHHAALVELVSTIPVDEVAHSPTLALLFGIAQARLGRHAAGERWVAAAAERARQRGDRTIEVRALNVSGAICLEGGRIDDAAGYFTQALAEAERNGDRVTVGRASNNLGIVANLRGQHGRAVGSYTMALAAFQQVGHKRGAAETLHNLAITYRDRCEYVLALETSDRAVEEAEAAGDLALRAQARSGRAEVRLKAGEVALARREIEAALAQHRELGDVVGEAEDLRVLGCVQGASGTTETEEEAERILRDVVDRADGLRRPLLSAQAQRDLARLLYRLGRVRESADLARRARAGFQQLGAADEVSHLDELLRTLERHL